MMPFRFWLGLSVTCATCLAADEVSAFKAYVDSDVCARLMLGPITTKRTECSQSTVKDGAEPVLVRLTNNMVFTVNKQKMIRPLVGQLAEVSGQPKPKNGTMKLQAANAVDAGSIPAGDAGRRLLDARMYKTKGSAELHEKIRHELAMMPYVSEFDFISFALVGSDVILSGWTVRATNRSTAYNLVKNLPGVENVINNIQELPVGSFDMQIRAATRAVLQTNLSRYFWGSGSAIKIIVRNGQVILLGMVQNKSDSDIANIRANSVSGVFKVFNLLQVEPKQEKGA